MTKQKELELEFRRGYYLAVANLMRLHGKDVEARETLMGYGLFDPTGIDKYDLKVLRPLAKEAKRFQKLQELAQRRDTNRNQL